MKVVMCVNDGLKMSTGKIAAQCAHAAIGIDHVSRKGGAQRSFVLWKNTGSRIIVLKIRDDIEMGEILLCTAQYALATHIVCDAGCTEVKAGSRTVLAIGPASDDVLDKITGNLKLL